MKHELVLEGNTFVNNSFQHCCIGIDDGKITAIKKILTGDTHHRFSKQLLLPAGIDTHVHFREPGMTQKETIRSGSTAAAFGGISCVFDMPNTHPAGITKQALIDKKKAFEHFSIIDFGFHAGVTNKTGTTLNHLRTLDSVSHGFKLFLGETTNALTLPIEYLSQVLTQIKALQKPVFVHAEDEYCLKNHQRVEHSLLDHHTARPPLCETTAIAHVISIAKTIETPVHICHVSSEEALQVLQDIPSFVSYGVTPHHSLLHIETNAVKPSYLKVNPPLRLKKDQQAVFHTVQNGNVRILESDHAPHTEKEKHTDFSLAPSGIPGVETMYPLFLAHVLKDHLSFSRLIQLLCEQPARLFNLQKGRIATGFDADIIAIDKRKMKKIPIEQLHSKAGWSPFEGFQAVFPSHVYIRGTSVIEAYEQQVSKGCGMMVPISKETV